MKKILLILLLLIASTTFAQGISNPTVTLAERPYKVYTALLNQTGTDAPVATVLENTIGDIVWSYSDVGIYYGTLTGAFMTGKTWIPSRMLVADLAAIYNNEQVEIFNINVDQVQISSFVISTSNGINGKIINTPIEIRVYN